MRLSAEQGFTRNSRLTQDRTHGKPRSAPGDVVRMRYALTHAFPPPKDTVVFGGLRRQPGLGMGEKRTFLTVVLLLPLGLFFHGVDAVAGQQPGDDRNTANDPHQASMEVSPCGATPGTTVIVRGTNLPPSAAVHIGFGGVGLGFEGLAFVLTTPEGLLEESVEVPTWARPERDHRFLIYDLYFERILVWRSFHVTDSEGKVMNEVEGACSWVFQDASGQTAPEATPGAMRLGGPVARFGDPWWTSLHQC